MSDNPTLHYTSPNLNLAFNMHPCLHGGEGHPKHLDKGVKSSQHQLNFSTSQKKKHSEAPSWVHNEIFSNISILPTPKVSFWGVFSGFLVPGKLHMFHEPWVISTCVFGSLDSLQVFAWFFWLQILFWKIHENSLSTSPCSFFFRRGGGVLPDLERLKNSTVHMI